MKTRLLLTAMVTFSVVVLGAAEQVGVRVSPAFAIAPADLRVRATVPANDENRSVEFIAESDQFYRSSEVPLDGDRSPKTTQVDFRSLPAGYYSVRVIVKRSGGREVASSASHVHIAGINEGEAW